MPSLHGGSSVDLAKTVRQSWRITHKIQARGWCVDVTSVVRTDDGGGEAR